MVSAKDVAIYFLSKDPERKLFTKELIKINNTESYAGNIILNKILHLAQNIWIAKTGQKLIEDDFFALPNGAVVESVMNNFDYLCKSKLEIPAFEKDIKIFLDKIFDTFKYATVLELVELSHEDEEWEEKSKNYCKKDKKMDSLKLKEKYSKQYANILWALGRM